MARLNLHFNPSLLSSAFSSVPQFRAHITLKGIYHKVLHTATHLGCPLAMAHSKPFKEQCRPPPNEHFLPRNTILIFTQSQALHPPYTQSQVSLYSWF